MFLQKVTISFDMMVLVNSKRPEEAGKVARRFVQKQAANCNSDFRVTRCVVAEIHSEIARGWRDQQPWSEATIDFITCEEIIEGKDPTVGLELEIDEELLCTHCHKHSGLYRCLDCSGSFCHECLCTHKDNVHSTH